ncbi:hypothetical protein [Sporosarcina ureilytica]|uniref:VCBS repeat-containing protein n=1 Tax=Sporosarcina ureilytica TaxID=298596 RepID=A0A1D8JH28_9BACL|nr:hypothetical protein [Sporosarcina ureilytica]AOV07998.1 hypothetical protein BI350_10930 [Sporosarcina ureilytica]
MKKIMLLILLPLAAINFILITVHANQDQKKDLIKIIKEFMPPNSSLISPEKPSSTQPIQLYDFNHDGQKEIIFTFEIKEKVQPSPSHFGAIVLKKENADWRKVWETRQKGVGLDFSSLADITGDGTKEYLFGVTIGADIGSELEVFQWVNNSFKKIADVPYHKIDIVKGNPKVGIAVWQKYVGDSYLVDVLKWNDEKLVYDKELYSKYYPKIDRFYRDKISEMDAWFYWYSLADAQIKAEKFEEASKSIQKGISLTEKIPMLDVSQEFNDLTERLKNKRK